MPTARSLPAAVALDGRIYVLGGMDAGGAPLATVEAYDPASDSWAGRQPLPAARADAAAAMLNGRVHLLGGWAVSGATTSVVTSVGPLYVHILR